MIVYCLYSHLREINGIPYHTIIIGSAVIYKAVVICLGICNHTEQILHNPALVFRCQLVFDGIDVVLRRHIGYWRSCVIHPFSFS